MPIPDSRFVDHEAASVCYLLPQAAEFVHAKLWDPESKRLRRSFRVGPSAAQGFADDYAYMIAGLLDLYQARAAMPISVLMADAHLNAASEHQ